jgi:hypothetical protein
MRLAVNNGRLTVVGGRPLVAVAADRFRNPPGSVHFMSQAEFELRFLSRDRLELTSTEGETTLYRRARGWTPSPAEWRAALPPSTTNTARCRLRTVTMLLSYPDAGGPGDGRGESPSERGQGCTVTSCRTP